MKRAKAQSVEAFLREKKRDPRWGGGPACRTCTHPQADAINRELRIFAKAKKAGHAMPWSRFISDRIRTVYGLNLAHAAVLRHVRECLGIPYGAPN